MVNHWEGMWYKLLFFSFTELLHACHVSSYSGIPKSTIGIILLYVIDINIPVIQLMAVHPNAQHLTIFTVGFNTRR